MPDKSLLWPELLRASFEGRADAVSALLKAGADVRQTSVYGRKTALHEAAMCNHADVARILLAHGADPNASDCNGNRPLHIAALNGSVAAAKVLLENGAYPQARTLLGRSAEYLARRNGHNALAECIRKAVYRNGPDEHGRTSR